VVIEAEAPEPGLLVLTDTCYPGWRASVDGAPAPILGANYLFRGVELTPGKHVIEFRFHSPAYRVGAAISAAFLAAVVLLGGCERRRPREGVRRPFGFSERVTIGNQTRLASGPAAEAVLIRRVRSMSEVPGSLELPEPLASAGEVLVHVVAIPLKGGKPAGPPRRRTARLAVDPGGKVAWAPLLAGPETLPADVTVHAIPAAAAREQHREARFRVPRGARLRVGYGVRDDVIASPEGRARFELEVRDDRGFAHRLLQREIDATAGEAQEWHRADLDLSRFAGQDVTVALNSWGDDGYRAAPVWSGPMLWTGEARRPNLVLISLDTLRARSLGLHGYGRDTSPFLDSLAEESAIFEQAMTTAATTSPAHMSMFTGVYPVKHGIMFGMEGKSGEYPALAKRLRLAGYQTAAFTENGFLIREYGFGEGFARYSENRGRAFQVAPGQVELTFSQARAWLRNQPPRPFFLFVHTYQVHSPYDPPPPYDRLFEGDGLAGHDDPRVRRHRDNYDREIRMVDDQLKGFFADLSQLGLERDTMVVVTSDHGEEFGEHGVLGHGSHLFEEVMHVPLIVRAPGRVAAGRRIPGVVSLIDLYPTLLEFAGVPVPDDIDGISLLPALAGAPLPERAVFAEGRVTFRMRIGERDGSWNPPLVAWRTARAKYIAHRPAKGEADPAVYYDLATDPHEGNPLPLAEADRERLDIAITTYLDHDPDHRALALDTDTAAAELDPEIREKLRQLGYLE
jgi:arylsulfatase A-like enzyme